MTKLWDQLPDRLRALPRPKRPEDLPGLRAILASGRVGNYRITDYVCRKGHRLAQVLKAPGELLIVQGLSETETEEPDDATVAAPVTFEEIEGMTRYRFRAKVWVLAVSELKLWADAFPSGAGLVFPACCRCGEHVLPASRVPADIADQRRRVVLGPKLHDV